MTTAIPGETIGQELEQFFVRFFNPQTKLLHSSAAVFAANPMQAVKAAIEDVQSRMRGTETNELPTYTASVLDKNGAPIVGYEVQLSKAQIVAQMQALQRQIDMLDSSGQTPQQVQTVQASVPNVDQAVAAPGVQNYGAAGPTPPQNVTPTSVEVSPAQAPQGSGRVFTQADIDAAVAEAQRQAGNPQ
jgi:hypothetical protein